MSASKFLVAAVAISMSATAFAAGAHGEGHGSGRSGHGGGHGAATGEPGKASEATRTITVEMHDNYYEPDSIEVKAV